MPETDFVAIDVETANPDVSSICQIGIAVFRSGELHKTWGSLLNPESHFDPGNVFVHGIDESRVRDSPIFPDLAGEILDHIGDGIVVCHTHFDRLSIGRAFERYDLESPSLHWLDTARVARRAWPELARRGYGLANVASKLGISFRHHDAVEDARAAGEVLLRACVEHEISAAEWLLRSRSRHTSSRGNTAREKITRDGDPDGPMAGEVVVFTGSLAIARAQAADLAASAGCRVAANVTSQTTLLVVGDQDLRQLNGCDKSSKHRRAEELILGGQSIRILQESDFMLLVNE
jgi:DNA polymerase-3 subunit epsilon